MTFLADTSMVIRLRHGRDVDERWLDAVRAGLVGVCPVVEAELVRATASKADRDQFRSLLQGRVKIAVRISDTTVRNS